jgi:hypothetical protein
VDLEASAALGSGGRALSSSLREVMPSLLNTLWSWYSAVRGLMKRRASTSGLERPFADEPRDVGRPGGEVVVGFGGTFAWALARGEPLSLGALRKPLETHPR